MGAACGCRSAADPPRRSPREDSRQCFNGVAEQQPGQPGSSPVLREATPQGAAPPPPGNPLHPFGVAGQPSDKDDVAASKCQVDSDPNLPGKSDTTNSLGDLKYEPAPSHPSEGQRIEALRCLQILDTAAEQTFDDLVNLAMMITGCTFALISIVDSDRQWFKAKCGIDDQGASSLPPQTGRRESFCGHCIAFERGQGDVLLVEDARKDPRFVGNPLVVGPPHIRFYGGFPIRDPATRLPIGTLCVISPEVMSMSSKKVEGMKALSRQVDELLRLRHAKNSAQTALMTTRRITTAMARLDIQEAENALASSPASLDPDLRGKLCQLVDTLGQWQKAIPTAMIQVPSTGAADSTGVIANNGEEEKGRHDGNLPNEAQAEMELSGPMLGMSNHRIKEQLSHHGSSPRQSLKPVKTTQSPSAVHTDQGSVKCGESPAGHRSPSDHPEPSPQSVDRAIMSLSTSAKNLSGSQFKEHTQDQAKQILNAADFRNSSEECKTWMQEAGLARRSCSVVVVEAGHLDTYSHRAEVDVQTFATEMFDVIRGHGGVLLSLESRRMLVGFNTHNNVNRHAEQACLAAVSASKRLSALAITKHGCLCRNWWGIGVYTGVLLCGICGDATQCVPNVSGDGIRVAAALAGLCPIIGETVLISGGTESHVSSHFRTIPVDLIQDPLFSCRVHSHDDPAAKAVYTIIGETRDRAGGADHHSQATYLAAFDGLRQGDWGKVLANATRHAGQPSEREREWHTQRIARIAEELQRSGHLPGQPAGARPVRRYVRPLMHQWPELESQLGLELQDFSPEGWSSDSMMTRRWQSDNSEWIQGLKQEAESSVAAAAENGTRPTRTLVRRFVDNQKQEWQVSDVLLGRGGFAKVVRGLDSSGAPVAVKVINLPKQKVGRDPERVQEVMELLIREVELLASLRHENIVTCHGASVQNGKLYIVMELIPAGSLEMVVEAFGPSVNQMSSARERQVPVTWTIHPRIVQRFARDIVEGLYFLHNNDVVHRDLKPGNVLLCVDGQAKITDFGLAIIEPELARRQRIDARDAAREHPRQVVGTCAYFAPETCVRREQTAFSDIWAVGLIVSICLIGDAPFPTPLGKLQLPTGFRFTDVLGGVPASVVDFIQLCLMPNPDDRPDARRLREHPFIVRTVNSHSELSENAADDLER